MIGLETSSLKVPVPRATSKDASTRGQPRGKRPVKTEFAIVGIRLRVGRGKGSVAARELSVVASHRSPGCGDNDGVGEPGDWCEWNGKLKFVEPERPHSPGDEYVSHRAEDASTRGQLRGKHPV